MLPAEAFADVVTFLLLFDLGALALTNAICSSLAIKASTMIRWEAFPDLQFYIWSDVMQFFRGDLLVANLNFPNEIAMEEFIADGFLNCIFEDVEISPYLSKDLLDAIGRVVDSVVVKGTLRLPFVSPSRLNVVRKFRNIEVSISFVYLRYCVRRVTEVE